MSLIISHNLSALNTQRNLQGSGESMAKAIEKLSSGYKINVGADDPSGLVISEQLRSQISGLERAVRNSSEAFNLIGMAEGALNEMNTILKKLRALAIHAANSGITSPEQVASDQAEMDSGIETLNRIANTTRYSDQYLLNGQKQLVYDVTTVVNEPTDHALLDTKMTRVDQVFKRDGVKMSIGFAGEKNQYQANTDTSAQRAYLEADNAHSLCEIDGATVTTKQEFILTGTSGSRLFSFAEGAHVGTIVDNINNVKDSTGIGAALIFASDVRIDRTTGGTLGEPGEAGYAPDYKNGKRASYIDGYADGTYVYQTGDVQIYGAGLNNVNTAKISEFCMTPDAAASFKVGFNCDGDGKIYAKVVDKSTNSIEYYKDKDCTMLIGQGDGGFFAATNNSGIPSSPVQNMDGLFIKLNADYARDQDVYELAVVGQRLDNQKDMNVTGIQGWTDADSSVMSGISLGVNTDPEGSIFFDYQPVELEADGKTIKSFQVNVYKHPSKQPQFLVASSGVVENNVQTELKDAQGNIIQRAGQTVRIESVLMDDGTDSGLNITLVLPKKSDLDGVTGPTLDEVKATQEYQDYLTKLNDAKEQYAEIQVDYTTAKDSRQKAVDALSDAMSSLKNTQKKEGTLRREIDRIEVRSIEQQSLDAQRDLEIAVIDMEDAARKAILAAENNADYMAVAKAMAAAQPTGPDAPEQSVLQLADQLVQAIQAEIIGGIAFDETNPTAKQGVISNVWGMSPLVGLALSTDDQAAVNSLLSDAYDAATKPELMKSVRDATQQIQDLSTLEDDYQAAKDALADSKTKFDLAVNEAVEAVAAKWENVAGVIEDGDLENLTEAIKNQIITYIGNPGLGLNPNNDAAADLTKNFTRYNWMTDKSDITADAIVAFGLGGGATGSATADQLAALASDIYDQLVAEDEFGDYGAAVQELYKHPDPAWGALPNANAYVTKITNEITTTIEAAKTTALAATPPNNNFANIEDWLTANGETWAALEADLALLITNTVNNGTTGNPNTLALASLTNGTLLGDIKTALTPVIAVGTYPVLNAALSLTTGISGQAAGAAVVDPTPELDALLDTVWNKISNATSDMYEYVKLDADNDTAFTAAGTASLALGIAGTSGPADDVYDAIKVSLDNLETAATAGVGAGNLPQAVADALAKQLYILSGEEGVDVTVAANLTNNPATQSLIISGILAEIDPAIAAGIDPATLKQFVTEVFTSYVTDTMPGGAAGSLSGAVGAPAGAAGGYFGDYTQLVDDFTELEEIYPNGGSLQRNQDRLDRYLQRVQEAPTTVRNGASTRKAWTSLVNTYGNPSTDANLTKLTEDFGTYVRDLVKLNAEAGTTDQINWKEDVYEHLYDMAQSPTGALGSLWNDIQAKIGNAATKTEGEADLANLQKILDRMFSSVANPEYIGGIQMNYPPIAAEPGEYVPVSCVKRYFDQYNVVEALSVELEQKQNTKSDLYDINLQTQIDEINEVLVPDLQDKTAEFAIWSREADPLLADIETFDNHLREMRRTAQGGNGAMPTGNMVGGVQFTNLGMRLFAVDYGSAETIRIQNKAGNLFYQYREADTMEKIMVEPDTTVQVAGQDAQISLNGAPVFTNGLLAETTTPDFSGSLVFNAGILGEATLAVTGHDTGKLFSKATALQGIEENEAQITQVRRHFEPPAMTVRMGDTEVKDLGMLNKTGNPVTLYMDFSQIDPTVEVKIDNLGETCDIKVEFVAPDSITIDATALGTDSENEMSITVKIDPQNLEDGYYVTDPALKGLFIRTDDLVDLNRSGANFAPNPLPQTTPEGGDVMLEVNTYATNPRSNTTESMDNFIGGMQFQLGNTEGDQDRTVYSIQSMAMSELGRISWGGQEYCLQNVLGGGLASLTKDPILAMRVLAKAVDDVSTLRARLGAFQANMLQSNINALGVAVENITKTESAIRDTDMAEQSTQFTRFQIMQQAGTSMLAQANQTAQNVLSLLQ